MTNSNCGTVIKSVYLNNEILVGLGHLVEIRDLGAEPCGHPAIHLITGLSQLLAQLQMRRVKTVMGAKGQRATEVTYQVILDNGKDLYWLIGPSEIRIQS